MESMVAVVLTVGCSTIGGCSVSSGGCSGGDGMGKANADVLAVAAAVGVEVAVAVAVAAMGWANPTAIEGFATTA